METYQTVRLTLAPSLTTLTLSLNISQIFGTLSSDAKHIHVFMGAGYGGLSVWVALWICCIFARLCLLWYTLYDGKRDATRTRADAQKLRKNVFLILQIWKTVVDKRMRDPKCSGTTLISWTFRNVTEQWMNEYAKFLNQAFHSFTLHEFISLCRAELGIQLSVVKMLHVGCSREPCGAFTALRLWVAPTNSRFTHGIQGRQ